MLKLRKAPARPGVYIFRRGRVPIYIGKALNLKKRLASYFSFRDKNRMPARIQKMLTEATGLEIIETRSEIEALIKEAELIKKHRPKYNVLMRDDKNYFFVGITLEQFPRIFVTHQPQSRHRALGAGHQKQTASKPAPSACNQAPRYIGPFTSGAALKTTLKLLRRVFPYCDCKSVHKRPCLSSQIGKCPGYCCMEEKRKEKRENGRREYRKNISGIIAVLSGKKTRLASDLRKQMKKAVKKERYEEAGRLRDQVFGLERVFSHRTVLRSPDNSSVWPATREKIQSLLKTDSLLERIEGYDISNISGGAAAGSMVVFMNGAADKNQYRKFKIKTISGASDVAMLKEIILRRFGHPEWPYPQLVVIDGGKPQLNAALETLWKSMGRKQKTEKIAITALAKKEEILYTESGRAIHLKREDPQLLRLFQRIRDESHRFARSYHHKLRRQALANAQ